MTSSSFKSVVFLFALLGGLAVILQGCGGDDDDKDDDSKKTDPEKPTRTPVVNKCMNDCIITHECSDDKETIKYDKCGDEPGREDITDKGCEKFDEWAEKARASDGKNDDVDKDCDLAGFGPNSGDNPDGNNKVRDIKCDDTCSVHIGCSLTEGDPKGQQTFKLDGDCTAKLNGAADPAPISDPDCKKFEAEEWLIKAEGEEAKTADNDAICAGFNAEKPKPDAGNGDGDGDGDKVQQRVVKCIEYGVADSTCKITWDCDPKEDTNNLKQTNEGCKAGDAALTSTDVNCETLVEAIKKTTAKNEEQEQEDKALCEAADKAPDAPDDGGSAGADGTGGVYLTASAKETPASSQEVAKSVDEPSQATIV